VGSHPPLRDLEHMEAPIYSTKAHDAIVHCIDGCGGATQGKGAAELVTSSKDKVRKISVS